MGGGPRAPPTHEAPCAFTQRIQGIDERQAVRVSSAETPFVGQQRKERSAHEIRPRLVEMAYEVLEALRAVLEGKGLVGHDGAG